METQYCSPLLKKGKLVRSMEFPDPENYSPDGAASPHVDVQPQEEPWQLDQDPDTESLAFTSQTTEERDGETEIGSAFLPPTLERREKRRPSPAAIDDPRGFTVKTEPSPSNDRSPHTLRTGSKRKFNPDEDGSRCEMSASVDRDGGFHFTRPTPTARDTKTPVSVMPTPASSNSISDGKQTRPDHSPKKRNALEPSMRENKKKKKKEKTPYQ